MASLLDQVWTETERKRGRGDEGRLPVIELADKTITLLVGALDHAYDCKSGTTGRTCKPCARAWAILTAVKS